MPLTQGANHAFHALIQIAHAPPGQTLTIEEMAGALEASPTYMAKLFQRLTHAGLVVSHRGRGGGYSLAVPASQITLWEIVSALQGNSATETALLPACLTCPLASACPLTSALEAAQDRVKQVLRTVNLGKMVRLLEDGSVERTTAGPSKEVNPEVRS